MKTFDEFYKESKINKMLLGEAKKIYDSLKEPELIDEIYSDADNHPLEDLYKDIPSLDIDNLSGFALLGAFSLAYKYATYTKTEQG